MDQLLGGEELISLLVLAIGGALAVGNLLALVRPRDTQEDGELDRAPLARSVLMIVLGMVASLWALASLVTAA